MSFYPYVCKYEKFPIGHLAIHAGDVSRHWRHVEERRSYQICVMLSKIYSIPSCYTDLTKNHFLPLSHVCRWPQYGKRMLAHWSERKRSLARGSWTKYARQYRFYKVIEVQEV
jgi:hypothetical protein